jgi:hypothetical protein
VRVDELARDPEQDGCLRGSEQLGCAQIGRVGFVEQRVEVVLAGLHNRQLVVTGACGPPLTAGVLRAITRVKARSVSRALTSPPRNM